MTKINKLGHELILRNKSIFEDVYYCQKCKIKVITYPKQSYNIYFYNLIELNITCDEMIIKNIIE